MDHIKDLKRTDYTNRTEIFESLLWYLQLSNHPLQDSVSTSSFSLLFPKIRVNAFPKRLRFQSTRITLQEN